MLAYPNFFCLKILKFENMKTVIETKDDYPDFEVYISDAGLLCFSSESQVQDENFFLPIDIDEAINMSEYIMKICKDYKNKQNPINW